MGIRCPLSVQYRMQTIECRMQNTEYRIQNTETHVLTITDVPVFYMALGRTVMILMRRNPLLGPLEGGGLRSLPFQGPKKSRFLGSTTSNGPQNGFAHINVISSSPK